MNLPVNDHIAGLFASIVDHRTNRMLHGAAAREYRLSMNNGVTGYQTIAIASFQQYIEPLLAQMHNQLQEQQQMFQQQMQMINYLSRELDRDKDRDRGG